MSLFKERQASAKKVIALENELLTLKRQIANFKTPQPCEDCDEFKLKNEELQLKNQKLEQDIKDLAGSLKTLKAELKRSKSEATRLKNKLAKQAEQAEQDVQLQED